MIDDPTPEPGGVPADERAKRIARVDTHVPTPRAAGGHTRTRDHERSRERRIWETVLRVVRRG